MNPPLFPQFTRLLWHDCLANKHSAKIEIVSCRIMRSVNACLLMISLRLIVYKLYSNQNVQD